MASLLLLKHSSFCHCSSTIKQPFYYNNPQNLFKIPSVFILLFTLFFYREILSLPDLLLKDFFKSGFNC